MNKKKGKILSSLFLVFVLVIGITGCGNTKSESAKTGDVKTEKSVAEAGSEETDKKTTESAETDSEDTLVIRLGDQSINTNLFYAYAKEVGILDKYFEGYNVSFEFFDFENGPAVNEAIAGESLDLAVMGNLPAVSGAAGGYGVKTLAIVASSNSVVGVVVRSDSGISSVEDFKGKTLGFGVGTATQYYISEALSQVGLTLDDVEVVNLGVADALTALESDQIDVAVSLASSAKALAEDEAYSLVDPKLPVEPAVVIVGSEKFINSYPEYTELIMKALAETLDYIQNDWDAFEEFYTNYLGYDSSSIVNTIKDNYILDFSSFTQEERESFNNIIQFAIENGLIENTDITIDDVLDTTAAKNAGF